MIQLTQEEIWAWNSLNSGIEEAKGELQRRVGARDAYTQLLEAKYNARFDVASGQFMPKDQNKGKEEGKKVVAEKREG